MLRNFLLLFALLFPCLSFADGAFQSSTLEIVTGDKSHFFTIEIAETPEQQSQGLMFRTSLDEDKGMLFLFAQRPNIRMWMKHTYIPLDMLFMDKTGKIIYIAHDTTPESTTPIGPESGIATAAVLEIAGGVSKKLGIVEGDIVKHTYFGK